MATPWQAANMERPDSDYPGYDGFYGEDPFDYSSDYWDDEIVNRYIDMDLRRE